MEPVVPKRSLPLLAAAAHHGAYRRRQRADRIQNQSVERVVNAAEEKR